MTGRGGIAKKIFFGESLASTDAWFVGFLKLADFECLRSRVRALDGACLRFGTTCSGVDVCSNIAAALIITHMMFKYDLQN